LEGFGIPVPKASIEYFDSIKVLVVGRFDRELSKDKKWIIRLPQEDMCQASGYSPALKYEADGGPGIGSIMNTLQSSIEPDKDRRLFMKTVFVYWILGAIDGHAKNFSIYLRARGRFSLAPLYDVMSAYPLTAKRQIEQKKMKMAMGLHSKNVHYHWHNLQRRHWLSQAKKCSYPEKDMAAIIEEIVTKTEQVISEISGDLPYNIPDSIREPILSGMQTTINKL
jgi:serine/threonine-protein kinase HipA